MNNIVEFRNVGLSFDGKKVFSDLNLSVSRGEKVLFKGQSGGGKSSAVEMMLGFLKPASGVILFDGKPAELAAVKRFRKQCSLIPQVLNFGTVTTAKKFIEEIFSFKANKPEMPTEETIISACNNINIDNSLLDKEINSLSGGERQRIAVLVAVLLKRDIIIADEPTSALDSANSKKIIDFLLSARGTLICISHDDAIVHLFDKVITFGEN